MPVYAILFGEVLGVLSKDVETARSDSIFYSFMFLVVGVVVGLAMFLQGNIKKIQIILRLFLVHHLLLQTKSVSSLPASNVGGLVIH